MRLPIKYSPVRTSLQGLCCADHNQLTRMLSNMSNKRDIIEVTEDVLLTLCEPVVNLTQNPQVVGKP